MVEFGKSSLQLMDDVCNAFNVSSTETLVKMTYRHVIIIPEGSHYFAHVLLHDTTHFDLMWATIANLPITITVDIYFTFESIDSFQNHTVHSQVRDENVGISDTTLMMERLHTQSPQGEVAQDEFVSPLHEYINASSDNEVNDDSNNKTDEYIRPNEDAAAAVDLDNANVFTDDLRYEPSDAENVQDDEQFAIDEEILLEEASDDEVHQPLPVYNEID
ncbi:hypothetical protein Syun_014911 [Stephania yunnanensis]|uniref:Uncharacterized protein n=1 Tax=Stephania yunnanensis TaxID=152371 RepID=A0AAP0PCD1_9MAGN